MKNNSLFCTILCHKFRLHRSDGFLRINRQSFHQPSELLLREFPDFIRGTRPLKMAVGQSFIKKQETVIFPHETFNPVGSPSAEQVERVRHKWLIPGTGGDDTRQPVDTGS